MNNTGFTVNLTGELAGCQMPGVDDLYCKFSFNYGTDWNLVYGLEHGITQVCRLAMDHMNETFVWNYPLDVSFQSTNVHGWPQIVLSIYGLNTFGNDVVRGYGSTHIPTTPGRHVRYVRLYRPVSSSLCQRITSWFSGTPPEFYNAKFIAGGKGREVTKVESAGTAKIVFIVATRGMASWGYDNGDGSINSINAGVRNKSSSGTSTGTGSVSPNHIRQNPSSLIRPNRPTTLQSGLHSNTSGNGEFDRLHNILHSNILHSNTHSRSNPHSYSNNPDHASTPVNAGNLNNNNRLRAEPRLTGNDSTQTRSSGDAFADIYLLKNRELSTPNNHANKSDNSDNRLETDSDSGGRGMSRDTEGHLRNRNMSNYSDNNPQTDPTMNPTSNTANRVHSLNSNTSPQSEGVNDHHTNPPQSPLNFTLNDVE